MNKTPTTIFRVFNQETGKTLSIYWDITKAIAHEKENTDYFKIEAIEIKENPSPLSLRFDAEFKALIFKIKEKETEFNNRTSGQALGKWVAFKYCRERLEALSKRMDL